MRYPKPEISVSGRPVSLIIMNNKNNKNNKPKYVDLIPHISNRVAEAVLTELIRELPNPTTKERAAYLKSHPSPLNTKDWSDDEKNAAAILYALTKYSEEQRTHAGKQIRGGLREIAEKRSTAKEMFRKINPLIPQTKEVDTLRKLFDAWLRFFDEKPRQGSKIIQETPSLSESSELEDEQKEHLHPDYNDPYKAVQAVRNNIAPKSKRKTDAYTDYFNEEKKSDLGTKRPRNTDEDEILAPVDKARRRESDKDVSEAKPAARRTRLKASTVSGDNAEDRTISIQEHMMGAREVADDPIDLTSHSSSQRRSLRLARRRQ
ncbi:hypothetical protein [Nitrosomonas communis]|uniref:hypothetical protein n=1 Tax=Nitrosomonas communis TaxID=44574 RepID=UPI001160D4AA|nr:hypothetical protein [Nitrosomonas communis]